MRFLWPAGLWGLLLLALAVLGYVRMLRRRSLPSITFSRVDLARAALGRSGRLRRHVPAVLFLLTLLAVVLALARPVVTLPVPSDRAAVMLAIDVSGSMLSQDVLPSRLEAAKAAAKAFVADLPAHARVGLVTFAGYAKLVAPPAADHERLEQTIDAVTTRHRTAIGDGLTEAVAALPGRVHPLPDGALPPLPPGPAPPGVVVLLSDGQNNAGMDPLQAADLARREAVTVYTVGIGQRSTSDGQWVIGGPVDEVTLRAIAQRTGGEYYHPSSGGQLRDIYRKLARSVGWEPQPVEVTAIAASLGAAALVAALVVSAVWRPLGM